MNMRRAPLLWLLVVAALALGPALATPLAHADDSPCDPTNGGYICDGTGKLSQPSEEAEEDIAMEGDDGISSSMLKDEPIPPDVQAILNARERGSMFRRATPESSYLPRNHQGQKYNNWCGPASMAMALNHMGVNRSQESLAAEVGIDKGNGGTAITVMQSVLNKIGKSRGFAWNLQKLPYTPTSKDRALYKKRLVSSITGQTGSGKRYPLIVNFYIPKGSARPGGYPSGLVRHHVEVRGYKASGEWTQIQDPASSIWRQVQAHYPARSDQVATWAGNRGYLY